MQKKLDRFQSFIKPKERNKKSPKLLERYLRLAEILGGEIVSNHAGSYCLVKTLYPFDYCHGKKKLFDIIDKQQIPLSAFTPSKEADILEMASMIFLDTETTGLGGTGTVAFLVGCGMLVKDGFEVRQYLLPDYSDETSMLEDLLEELKSDRILVSYNGAAFDLPVVRDRMIINRVATEVNYKHHLDLLHPVRRLYKRRLDNCRLKSIEKDLFGFKRKNDIPGHLIPSVYFEWLSEENPEFIPDVLKHNCLDIVSLLFLVSHLAEIYQSEGKSLDEIDDLYSLSRVYGKRKELELVKSIFKRLQQDKNQPLADDIIMFHALNFKRIKVYQKALLLWETLSDTNSKEGYRANIELAKYYEHKEKNPRKAYFFATKADKISSYGKYQQSQLTRRINRLSVKIESL